MVCFDLPTINHAQRTAYRKFQAQLKKNGYYMLQRSIYVKLLHYAANAEAEISDIQQQVPSEGNVAVMRLSFAQFQRMKQFGEETFDVAWFSDNIIYI